MLNNDQLQQKLNESPAPRVTQELIDSRIVNTEFLRIGETVTVCNITLDNGYSVRGESACVNAENYKQDIGERFARDDAFRKLWPLFGFLLAEDNFQRAAGTENGSAGERQKAA